MPFVRLVARDLFQAAARHDAVGLRIDDAVTRLQGDGFKAQIVRQSNAKRAAFI